MAGRFKIIEDILKTNDPEKSGGDRYSLSRVCLLISFILIMVFVFIPFFKVDDIPNYDSTITTFYNLILLFSAYSFGNKAIKRYQDMKCEISKNKD